MPLPSIHLPLKAIREPRGMYSKTRQRLISMALMFPWSTAWLRCASARLYIQLLLRPRRRVNTRVRLILWLAFRDVVIHIIERDINNRTNYETKCLHMLNLSYDMDLILIIF